MKLVVGGLAYGDECQRQVDGKEQFLPLAFMLICIYFIHLPLELDSQCHKDKYEELLEPNSSHVDVYPFQLLVWWRSWACP